MENLLIIFKRRMLHTSMLHKTFLKSLLEDKTVRFCVGLEVSFGGAIVKPTGTGFNWLEVVITSMRQPKSSWISDRKRINFCWSLLTASGWWVHESCQLSVHAIKISFLVIDIDLLNLIQIRFQCQERDLTALVQKSGIRSHDSMLFLQSWVCNETAFFLRPGGKRLLFLVPSVHTFLLT